MQQLRSVTFLAPIEVSRNNPLAQVNTGGDYQVEADERARVIRILMKGVEDPVCVPFERVSRYTPIGDRHICPECDQTFENATALGAHRRHKHNVKGGTLTEEKE